MHGMENTYTILVKIFKRKGLLEGISESGMLNLNLHLQNCLRKGPY